MKFFYPENGLKKSRKGGGKISLPGKPPSDLTCTEER
jgi:hypothetical protein